MRTPFIHLLVPCAPKAFCTGETPRWYCTAAREVRRKTFEKLDMIDPITGHGRSEGKAIGQDGDVG